MKTVGAADVIIHNSINLAVHLILIEPPGNRSCITKLVKNKSVRAGMNYVLICKLQLMINTFQDM